MSAAGSTSAREAALKILLQDVEPLVQRVEETTVLLAGVQQELNNDLTTLGGLMQRINDSQVELDGATRKVHDTVTRAASLATSMATTNPAPAQPAPGGGGSVWIACLVSAIVAASLVGGILYAIGHEIIDQARIGRSLQEVWPSLDEATRKRVEQQMNR